MELEDVKVLNQPLPQISATAVKLMVQQLLKELKTFYKGINTSKLNISKEQLAQQLTGNIKICYVLGSNAKRGRYIAVNVNLRQKLTEIGFKTASLVKPNEHIYFVYQNPQLSLALASLLPKTLTGTAKRGTMASATYFFDDQINLYIRQLNEKFSKSSTTSNNWEILNGKTICYGNEEPYMNLLITDGNTFMKNLMDAEFDPTEYSSVKKILDEAENFLEDTDEYVSLDGTKVIPLS